GPLNEFSPGGPGDPSKPRSPGAPTNPSGPFTPDSPGIPASPISPLGPVNPSIPSRPGQPRGPGINYYINCSSSPPRTVTLRFLALLTSHFLIQVSRAQSESDQEDSCSEYSTDYMRNVYTDRFVILDRLQFIFRDHLFNRVLDELLGLLPQDLREFRRPVHAEAL
ncbi:Neurofilament medium polypeptide, partial [Ooceraea biroi]